MGIGYEGITLSLVDRVPVTREVQPSEHIQTARVSLP
jgi:hypothetical protein